MAVLVRPRIDWVDRAGLAAMLDALALAVQLDEAETSHLFDLAHGARPACSGHWDYSRSACPVEGDERDFRRSKR